MVLVRGALIGGEAPMQADRDGTLTTVVAPGFHDGTQESRLVATLHRVREIAMEEHRNDLAAAIDEELKHITRTRALTVVVAAEVSRGKVSIRKSCEGGVCVRGRGRGGAATR